MGLVEVKDVRIFWWAWRRTGVKIGAKGYGVASMLRDLDVRGLRVQEQLLLRGRGLGCDRGRE